jgi:MFS family permease
MLGEFALSRLSDHLGRKPVLVLGLSLFSAQFIGLVIFRDPNWIMLSFVLAGLGNALYDPALSAHLLDIASPDSTGRIMGLKSTAGSVGSMLGPGLAVFFTPFVSPHVIFLIASAWVWLLTLTSAFVLRGLPRNKPAPGSSNAAVSR